MIDVVLEAPLPPKGKGRPRWGRVGKGDAARMVTFTPTETRRWEADLGALAAAHLPPQVLEGPVRVDILAIAQRPKRLLRRADPDGLIWRTSRPDADNTRKSVLDALKTFWRDDSQVCAGETLCAFAERTGRARVVVRIRSEVGDLDQRAADLGLVGVAR